MDSVGIIDRIFFLAVLIRWRAALPAGMVILSRFRSHHRLAG